MEIPRGISRKTIGGISEDSFVKLKKNVGNFVKNTPKRTFGKDP